MSLAIDQERFQVLTQGKVAGLISALLQVNKEISDAYQNLVLKLSYDMYLGYWTECVVCSFSKLEKNYI
ncbi:hypothetical protein V6N13_091186 [Hibiscus sabdariffa]